MSSEKTPYHHSDGTDVLVEDDIRVKKPNMYRVLLLNDDYTPMEFVIWLLQKVFHKGEEEATRLMLDVHTKGQGVCGIYTYDVARTKVYQVQELSRKNDHPLECVMEVISGDEGGSNP